MEMDHTVLLVDADVSKPSVLKVMGLKPERGLMDVLCEQSFDLSSSLLRTNIPKLSILPAGMPHERATELLASEAMDRLLEDMASRYSDRVIIFDSPPLIPTTEARVLASHMGQIVMVVEAGRTTTGALKQALSAIEACPIKLMVLNKAKDGGPGGYYGYGYGYGYGRAKEAAVDAV
jgi:receptor protein-tyrosine kinase